MTRIMDPDDIAQLRAIQNNRCVYCGQNLKWRNMEIDHIMPKALGGSNNHSNLQLLCIRCNQLKKAQHPDDFKLRVEIARMISGIPPELHYKVNEWDSNSREYDRRFKKSLGQIAGIRFTREKLRELHAKCKNEFGLIDPEKRVALRRASLSPPIGFSGKVWVPNKLK